jgi:hypothetical protein
MLWPNGGATAATVNQAICVRMTERKYKCIHNFSRKIWSKESTRQIAPHFIGTRIEV